MKLQELIQLNEGATTIRGNVDQLDQLRDGDGKYLAGTVNVTGYVSLCDMDLKRFPVRFGAVGGHFNCYDNWLTTLEGAPSSVGDYFYCGDNRLTTLKGAPSSVGGNFQYRDNRLTTLVGVHRIIKRIDGRLYLWGNQIRSGGIGLLLVEGLTRILADQSAFMIINAHLGQGNRGLLLCQEALHDAGFAEFARL